MKTLTRWLLALLLVATPMLAVVELASANTELVPASRLVVPYFDISGSRSTLIMLTNVSKSVDLLSVPIGGQPARAVHVEFYDKTCSRTDTTIELSASDIDQLNLKILPNLVGNPSLPTQLGWVDIDVRKGDAQRDKISIQCNVLVGTVIISDSAGDFALAYPAASSVGSSTQSGVTKPCGALVAEVGGHIVTHDSNGAAVAWSGRYEPFPSRVLVPFFFAEGGPLGMTSQLVIAAPAHGNWDFALGESPGQHLGTTGDSPPSSLMSGTALFFDGCENKNSFSFGGHYVNGSLGTLFGTPNPANQSSWKTPSPSTCKGVVNFPSVDADYSGAFVGWIDLPNTKPTVAKPRGMVGLLIQPTTIGKKEADTTRLWGDPKDGGRDQNYSLVDDLGTGGHDDLN